MRTFKKFLAEQECPLDETPVTARDLIALEKELDRVFNKKGVDIEFTRHFLDRINDERNKRQITICELKKLFLEVYKKHAKAIAQSYGGDEAVLTDVSTKVNVPFVVRWSRDKNAMELISKTVMRKKGFKTQGKRYTVK